MKRNLVLLLLFLVFGINAELFAQSEEYMLDIESIDSVAYKIGESGYDHNFIPVDTLNLPINFYIVTYQNGTGGLDPALYILALNNLNNAYKTHLIKFYLNQTSTIASDTLADLDEDEFDTKIVGKLGSPDAFNVFFTPNTD